MPELHINIFNFGREYKEKIMGYKKEENWWARGNLNPRLPPFCRQKSRFFIVVKEVSYRARSPAQWVILSSLLFSF